MRRWTEREFYQIWDQISKTVGEQIDRVFLERGLFSYKQHSEEERNPQRWVIRRWYLTSPLTEKQKQQYTSDMANLYDTPDSDVFVDYEIIRTGSGEVTLKVVSLALSYELPKATRQSISEEIERLREKNFKFKEVPTV